LLVRSVGLLGKVEVERALCKQQWRFNDIVIVALFFNDGVLGILPPYIAKTSEAPVCRGL
jgi:hypothetical protein